MEISDKVGAGTSSASCACRDVASAECNVVVTAKEEDEGRCGEEEVDEDDDGEEDDSASAGFVLGPLIPLKEQLEKDKDDESLRRWKEKLLGCIDEDLNGQIEPEVQFHSLGIISYGSAENTIPLPVCENNKHALFTLREGSTYCLKLTFTVQHNIVSGLTYSNKVWKGGFQVDQSRGMLGTFAPQREPYVQMLDEETTPSGVLARGIYSARLKFEDDDKRCHLELNYSFEIKKC